MAKDYDGWTLSFGTYLSAYHVCETRTEVWNKMVGAGRTGLDRKRQIDWWHRYWRRKNLNARVVDFWLSGGTGSFPRPWIIPAQCCQPFARRIIIMRALRPCWLRVPEFVNYPNS